MVQVHQIRSMNLYKTIEGEIPAKFFERHLNQDMSRDGPIHKKNTGVMIFSDNVGDEVLGDIRRKAVSGEGSGPLGVLLFFPWGKAVGCLIFFQGFDRLDLLVTMSFKCP